MTCWKEMESYLVVTTLILGYIWPMSLYSGEHVPSQLGFSKNWSQTLQVEQKGFGDMYCISTFKTQSSVFVSVVLLD